MISCEILHFFFKWQTAWSHISLCKLPAPRAMFSSLKCFLLRHFYIPCYKTFLSRFKTDPLSCTVCFTLLQFLHLKIYNECLYNNLFQKARSTQNFILRLVFWNSRLLTGNNFLSYQKLKLPFCTFCELRTAIPLI